MNGIPLTKSEIKNFVKLYKKGESTRSIAKKFNVGRMIHESWNRIKIEVEKCDLVCANCHRIRTYKNMAH